MRFQRNTQIRLNPITGQSTTHHTVETNVRAELSSSNVSISGENGGQAVQTNLVDVDQNGMMQDRDPLGIIQSDVGQRAQVINTAAVFDVDMRHAGFNEQQMQNPRLKASAHQVWSSSGGDPGKMQAASSVANIMGPEGLNMHNVEVFESMVDAGWNGKQITRPDLVTADVVIQEGGDYPTPQYVREARKYPKYTPGSSFSGPIQRDVVEKYRSGSGGDGVKRNGPNGPEWVGNEKKDFDSAIGNYL
jgi:hypothetical protein